MLISLITATLNSASTLRDTLDSVLSQTYGEWELWVIDGGSVDGTISIVEEYEPCFGGRLHWVSEKDRGLYDAINKGIGMAKGEVIGYLNSDDYFTTTTILQQVSDAFEQDTLDAVFGDVHYVNPENKQKCVRYYSSRKFSPSRLRFGYMPAHPSFYCRREVFEKHGAYAIDYELAADFDLMVRLFYKAKISYKYLPIDMVTMRTGGMSTRNLRNRIQLTIEDAKACRRYGLYSNFLLCSVKYFTKIFEFSNMQKITCFFACHPEKNEGSHS